MKTSSLILASAVVTALSIGATSIASAQATEKCYGVAKAGKNDCQTATSSCAGTSKKDQQADAWISVPAGTCSKLVGGSLTAKKS
jgi:uncharacterized membrane protein